MSIENQETAAEKIKDYLIKVQKFLESFSFNPNLSDTEKYIISEISQQTTKMQNNSESYDILGQNLHSLVSHLEAILHNIKLKMGASVFLPFSEISDLQKLIDEGYRIINLHYKKTSEHDNKCPIFSPILQINEKEEQYKELNLCAEQKRLYNPHTENPALKNFLQAIWEYAIQNGAASKKLFISYAWPVGNDRGEKWTKNFIMGFAKNLCLAGFQVYIDEIHSGPGMWLREFMRKIHTMDHVLVINTKTMDDKLKLDASGVRYEAERIKECSKFKNQSDFVFNILLNNNLYSDKDFHEFPYISFFEEGYLEALKKFISSLYKHDFDKFSEYWQNQLEYHKVNSKLWNLKPLTPLLVPRNSLTERFENLLNNNLNIICYGEKGSGKTEFVKHYIHERYAKYKVVYWFNAFSQKQLVKQYLDLAKEEEIEVKTIDFNNSDLFAMRVKNWLEEQSDILIVFDDVISYENIKDLIPEKNCQIALISANLENIKINDYFTFEIGNFTEEETQEYILKAIGNKKIEQAKQKGNFDFFMCAMGTMPLKVARVVAIYSATENLSKAFSNYIKK